MTILLLKSDGSTRTFTTQELATILVSLEASNATSQTTSGITFVRIAANRLLIMDDNVLHFRTRFYISATGAQPPAAKKVSAQPRA